jgi:uncharacterized cupredoxin-like copper-binding protein
MKLSITVFLMSILLSLPVVAASGHGTGEGDMHNQPSSHDHASMAGAHHSEASAGPVGSPAEPSESSEVINVSLTDEMKITFDRKLSSIKSGTVIQFIVKNEGKIPHEFSIGNQSEQQKHAEMMRKMPGMTHSDGNTMTVEPGMTETLTWDFEGDDVVVFACNIPGHYEAGMFQKAVLKP